MTHSHVSGKVPDGLKPKDLIGIPWMVAFALRNDGWYLRQDIIWHKPNPMPESVTDRCTKSHEYIFLLSKSKTYYYDAESIKEPVKQDWGTRDRTNGKYHNAGTGLNPHTGLQKSYEKANKRSVWSITTKPFHGAHFATFPPDLIEPCVIAGSPEGGIVLDPFFGSGTTGLVAMRNNRKYLGCELNSEYISIANERLKPVETEIKNKEITESLIQNYFQF
jgi:DNA modification methylase